MKNQKMPLRKGLFFWFVFFGQAKKMNKCYSDWFLPSLGELRLMYQNKELIGEFRDQPYWSSTEERAEDAWLIEFVNGDEYDDFKTNERRVRAIRRF
jgi:hypothetical protein